MLLKQAMEYNNTTLTSKDAVTLNYAKKVKSLYVKIVEVLG